MSFTSLLTDKMLSLLLKFDIYSFVLIKNKSTTYGKYSQNLFLYEECKLKCSEYDGLPLVWDNLHPEKGLFALIIWVQVMNSTIVRRFFHPKKAFHKYEQVVSGHEMNERPFFVDSHYDFVRAQWYSG